VGFSSQTNQIFDLCDANQVCFVSDESFEGEFETVECGDKFFNYCTLEEAKNKSELLKNSDAVQLYLDTQNAKDLIKKLNFTQFLTETVSGYEILYGYTPLYPDSIYLEGKKINVQIAWRDESVVVGFPLILTGF
jgi:hypothetical protein